MNAFRVLGLRLLLALSILLLATCDSGSGSGSPTAPRTLSYRFIPDSAAPSNSVSIQVVPDGDGIRFRVQATDLTNLHSYDYEVRLPPALVRFTTGQADFGDMLTGGQGSSGGATNESFEFATSLAPTEPGRTGSGSLGSAGRYVLNAPGEGRVEFERALFLDGAGLPLSSLRLIGGTLRVISS